MIACAVAHSFVAQAASPVVRVKAKLTAFDGQVMTLEPLPSKDTLQAKAEPFTVSILPGTRYVSSDKAVLDSVKPGAYAGAAVTEGQGGSLSAVDIYLYAEALRGSGEGRFSEAGFLGSRYKPFASNPPHFPRSPPPALSNRAVRTASAAPIQTLNPQLKPTLNLLSPAIANPTHPAAQKSISPSLTSPLSS